MTAREIFYKALNVTQHAEFESKLASIVFDREKREQFYRDILEYDHDIFHDTFKAYFEEYSAERKSNQQDYTPDEVAKILAGLTRSDANKDSQYSGADLTAGTGSLLMQKWADDMLAETPFTYAPHNYFYFAQEYADNVIYYLLHNLALRGMNCVVLHGDTLEGKIKQIYFVQNDNDDYLGFSSINVMPHTDDVKRSFEVNEWLEEAIEHVESGYVKYVPTLPMRRQALKVSESTPGPYVKKENQLKLEDVATVERAKSKKVYPLGTIIIQMSATQGQIGLLKSSGEIEEKYAVVDTETSIWDAYFLFCMIKIKAPRHFNRVQQGLNLTLDDIKQLPLMG